METKELETKLGTITTELEKFIKKYDEEFKANGKASEETKAACEKLGKDWNEMSARMLAAEQKLDAHKFGSGQAQEAKSAGEIVTESEAYKALAAERATRTGKINVGSFHKTAIVNATGQNQPWVPADRQPFLTPIQRRLTVRDLLSSTRTNSNSIEYAKENSFTNNAAPQYSAGAYENVTKAESALTFTLSSMPCSTVAHWIPISNQMLADAPAIQGYVNQRLMYGLKLVEESELLTGSGIQGHLSGLVTNATTMSTTPVVTASDTYIDVLRRAITQVQTSDLEPTGIVLNPQDWEVIELTKESGTGISSGMYVFANPRALAGPTLWGLPVVVTNSMTQSQFLVGNFLQAAMIFDRADATVEISREHSDYFVRNMSAILCEERLALVVFRAAALIYGGFPFGS